MCGIFGFSSINSGNLPNNFICQCINQLFVYSQSRGMESSGIAILKDNFLKLEKTQLPATSFIKSKIYQKLLRETFFDQDGQSSAIGITRLTTDGAQHNNDNNQPVETHSFCCVHNGIIVNDDILWNDFFKPDNKPENDTKIFLEILEKLSEKHPLSQALNYLFSKIEGSVSTAIIDKKKNKIILATNHGSLYYAFDENQTNLIFASEQYILKKVLTKSNQLNRLNFSISQLKANRAIILNLKDFQKETIKLAKPNRYESSNLSQKSGFSFKHALSKQERKEENSLWFYPKNNHLKRCSRCILPETMPFIQFDKKGICNYCHHYQKLKMENKNKLLNILDKHRSKNGSPDCIVAFSGGRDSSYGLHLLKKEFGMTPIAYTYDWGVVTDMGRRNQARMCGRLGIEHVIFSANIKAKRNNVNKNVKAWLHKPELGLIPLFMAGDKQFFYYANKIKKQTGIELLFFCQNFLERVEFKAGFCGINNFSYSNTIGEGKRYTTISTLNKFKIAFYYIKEFLVNPRYLNKSLFDTFWAYLCYYFIHQDHIYLYQYIPWDENIINQTLIEEYDWETVKNSTSTWRIGDGTAAFYNYIYRTITGFTENDCLRSNQIREGLLDRKNALEMITQENLPRKDAIFEYLDMINVDYKKSFKMY